MEFEGAMTKSDGANANDQNDSRSSGKQFSFSKPSAPDYSKDKLPVIIGRDPDDGSIVILDNGRTASFKNGQWQPGVLFHNRQILHDFRDVNDPAEVTRILQEAADALRKSVEKP
jgi:hypothetical protein